MSELRAEGVTVRYGARTVLASVDGCVRGGSSLAVSGPAGAGKTTLLHAMAGLIRPEAGRVTLDGVEVTGRVPGLGFVPQTLGLAEALTAGENVGLPLRAARLPPAEIEERIAEVLARLGLDGVTGQLAAELSGGQQQRVAVARALVGHPSVVIADEPTAELDADNRDLALDLVLSALDWGAVVVVASHDEEVAGRCSTRLELHDGMVVSEPTTSR